MINCLIVLAEINRRLMSCIVNTPLFACINCPSVSRRQFAGRQTSTCCSHNLCLIVLTNTSVEKSKDSKQTTQLIAFQRPKLRDTLGVSNIICVVSEYLRDTQVIGVSRGDVATVYTGAKNKVYICITEMEGKY